MRAFGANAVLFSVGGIVSFYPTQLRFQTPVPYLHGERALERTAGWVAPWRIEHTQRAHRDGNVHYINGLDILGPLFAHLLPDQLHPNAEGYRPIGERYTPLLAQVLRRRG